MVGINPTLIPMEPIITKYSTSAVIRVMKSGLGDETSVRMPFVVSHTMNSFQPVVLDTCF